MMCFIEENYTNRTNKRTHKYTTKSNHIIKRSKDYEADMQ